MTAAAPWSVKGIDPKAREVAKDHARRSGMTLGAWLNRVILEDDPQPLGPDAHRPWSANPGGDAELARLAGAVERLADRLEASETRTGLAVSGVEHAVRQALGRIEAAERESLAVAARVEGAVEALGSEQARLTERLNRMAAEAAGPRSAEALRVIEQAVSGTAGQVHALESRLALAEAQGADPDALAEAVLERAGRRLAEAESRTTEALDALRASVGAFDARLQAVEGAPGAQDEKLEGLARRLSEQVEAARSQFAEQLKRADLGGSDGRVDQLARDLEASERRSAEAMQQMGRQVLAMAEAVDRRLRASEDRNAEAIAQLGGEITRAAEATEARLALAERGQAEALERLSAELGGISERLSDRLLLSERRAADAMEGVGLQVERVTERMTESQSRTTQELAETIRESEARMAALLDEARGRLEQRLGDAPPSAPVAPAPPSSAPFGPELFSRAEETDDDEALELLDVAMPPPAPFRGLDTPLDFAPIPEPEDEDLFGLDQPEPPKDSELRPQLSTREVIEEARAAARAATPAEAGPAPAARTWTSGGFFGIRPRRGPSSTLQTALLVAGGAAFLSVGAAGVVLVQRQPGVHGGETTAADSRAAVALTPTSTAMAAAPAAHRSAAPASDALAAAFVSASREVEAGKPGALGKMRALAEADYAPAQFYLGKLYEIGGRGVRADVKLARVWTQKAAQGGDAAAMHNMALFAFRGEGGPQDSAAAARWFRAAAERGVVDSQYNLGLLYQAGAGVPADPAQAYLWFSVAARGGDAQARASAQRLKDQLSAEQQAQAEVAIAHYAAGGAQKASPQAG